MTDKQQIEELTKDLSRLQNCGMLIIESQMDWRGSTHKEIKNKVVAEALYNAGYRKVDGNSVVLTEEEWGNLAPSTLVQYQWETIAEQAEEREQLYEKLSQARKETAKEILQLLRKAYARFEYKPNISKKAKWIAVEDLYKQANWLVCTLPNAILDELAKQYGVEVDNDR